MQRVYEPALQQYFGDVRCCRNDMAESSGCHALHQPGLVHNPTARIELSACRLTAQHSKKQIHEASLRGKLSKRPAYVASLRATCASVYGCLLPPSAAWFRIMEMTLSTLISSNTRRLWVRLCRCVPRPSGLRRLLFHSHPGMKTHRPPRINRFH